ncbi:MAG: DUF6171 family protein [Chitinophagaceae bacterium]
MSEILDNLKNIIETNKNSAVGPLDALNPSTEWADSEMSDSRMSICKSCPDLIKLTKQCRKCGCFMHIKTKIEKASCPVGKW